MQAAAHYQRALQIDATNSTAQSEAALVEHARRNIEAGNAILDTDARQAQWYADVASRQITPVLEPAAMLRCKVSQTCDKHEIDGFASGHHCFRTCTIELFHLICDYLGDSTPYQHTTEDVNLTSATARSHLLQGQAILL